MSTAYAGIAAALIPLYGVVLGWRTVMRLVFG